MKNEQISTKSIFFFELEHFNYKTKINAGKKT